ncbi:MAG: hypothetical protein IKZ21_01970, partial [Clostridia bacterium]|nr:hypothetical protein [Clostridia bacterium]
MVYANQYIGANDNEVLETAIQNRDGDGIVVIGPRTLSPDRDWWLLDRAILLPQDTTVILDNRKIKLSDPCRDNFFRSANCGIGFPDPQPLRNIRILGKGLALLEGADR